MNGNKNKHKFVLVTSCSVTRSELPLLCVRDIPIGTMQDALTWWVHHLKELGKKKSNLHTPGELYQGFAYTTITEMAQLIGHDNIYIVTGGQGLIKLTEPIVPYDFTSDKKAPENIHQRIRGEKFIPSFWWRGINQHMRDTTAPVARLLQDPDTVVIGALPKGFIKYIIQDLLEAGPNLHRVFIPVPRSMMGSFPHMIHRALVPYDNSFVEGLSYNRYNKQHVVAQRLLTNLRLASDTEQDLQEVAKQIASDARADAAARVINNTADVDYPALFTEHPELLKCTSPQQAIKLAKVLGITYGGKHRFTAAWRGATGNISDILETDKETESKGKAALTSLFGSTQGGTEGPTRSNTELLQQCGLFVKLVRENFPQEVFNASMVAQWGKDTYGEGYPTGITSPLKLVYILEYNATYLGLEVIKGDGKVFFKVKL